MKKIFLLGASSDIGLETTKLFLENNWEVTAHYNSSSKTLKLMKKKFKNLHLIKFNLKKITQLETFVKKNKFYLGKFDCFVSLTGYLKYVNFKNFKIKEFYDHLNVNYFSNLIIIREILKGMEKRKYGRILLSSSIGTKFGGGPNSFAYSLSKFNNEFFPSYYKNLTKKNILINTLQIGVTDTKIHKNLPKKNLKQRVKLIPIKRMARTKEVADYIFFLSSSENTLLSRTVLNISGGE